MDRRIAGSIPFGAGPRVCIGKSFAMMEAKIIVAMVAQRYRLELVPGCVVETNPGVTLRPKSPVNVVPRRQDEASRRRIAKSA